MKNPIITGRNYANWKKNYKDKNLSPPELMVFKVITSITDNKIWDRILDRKKVRVYLVVNGLEQNTYHKAHEKHFVSSYEQKKENTYKQRQTRLKNPKNKSMLSLRYTELDSRT